ncbi:MAG: hypothetical protein M3R17_16200 [Bacteroidota bacterium]|nr:hypothetical protein [Bacteroidota bacterium]
MKAINLLLAACLFSVTAFAQTAEFVESRNVLKAETPELSTFKVKDITYVMYDSYNKSGMTRIIQLDAYDATMKFAGTSLINKSDDPAEPGTFEGVYALSDKLVLFKSSWDKKGGMAISVFPVNGNAEKQAGTLLCKFTAEKMMNTGSFSVNVSPDGSKFVVFCELPSVKDSLERAFVYVYDNNFKQLWMKDYYFPNDKGTEKYRYNDVYINNAGVVFDMKQVPVKKEVPYFTVFTFLNNGAKVEERKMDLGEGGHVSTYKTGFAANGDLIMSGYCYPDKKVGVNVETMNNAFFVKVSSADGGMPVDKLTPIAPNASIKAKYLVMLPDNGAILVGETERITETPRVGAGATTTSGVIYDYDFNNSNISAIKMGADGVKKWEHTIDRDMKSRNDGARTLGIYACMMGENLVITYQDFIYRHDGQAHMVAAGNDFWRVNVVRKINAEGINAGEEYIKDKRLAGRDAEYALLPATGMKTSETTMYFIAIRGLELIPAKITL